MFESDLESVSVLLVDDDDNWRALAADSLERRFDPFTVVSESSAADGLAQLDDGEFDCIVSDYLMPGMDGLAFLEQVRETHPGIPFILLTGAGSEDVASEAISQGVTDYLQKKSGSGQYAVMANRIRNAVEQYRFRHRVYSQYEAMEAAMDGMAILDEAESYEFVNQAYAEIHGYEEPADLVGESWTRLYDDVELERIQQEVMPEFRAAGQWRGEAVGQRADGTTFPQEVSLSALDDGRIVWAVRDVTRRKQRTETLEETNRHLEAVLDTTSAAVFLKDRDGRYLLMNQECRDLLGVEEGLVGVTDHDLFPDALADEYRANDRRVFESGEPMVLEEDIPTVDGPRVFRTLRSPVFNDDGDLYGVCGVSTDVTEQTEAERRLRRQSEQWVSAADAVSRELADSLSTANEKLERERSDAGRESGHLAAVADALDRMETVVADVSTLARHGRDVTDTERVALSELAADEWEPVETGDSTLCVESDTTFHADPDRLGRAFEDLFRNAVAHNDEDVTVQVGSLDDERGFYVEDDGSGIPPGADEEIFEPDFSTIEDGTGLGLVIVRQIVEAHGWQITTTKNRGGGARFEIAGVDGD